MKIQHEARYTLRIEDAIKAKAKEAAAAQKWSFNTWVGVAIEEKLRNEGRLSQPQEKVQ